MIDLTKMQKITGERTRYYAGIVFVPKGTAYRRTYETAAWWTEMETVEDRWYPVFASYSINRWRLTAIVDAVITAEYTPSLYGGVPIGSQPQGKDHRNVGKSDQFPLNMTPQMIDAGVIRPRDVLFVPVTLGFSIRQNFYFHLYREPRTSNSWEWVPYIDVTKMEPLDEMYVTTYGSVVPA